MASNNIVNKRASKSKDTEKFIEQIDKRRRQIYKKAQQENDKVKKQKILNDFSDTERKLLEEFSKSYEDTHDQRIKKLQQMFYELHPDTKKIN